MKLNKKELKIHVAHHVNIWDIETHAYIPLIYEVKELVEYNYRGQIKKGHILTIDLTTGMVTLDNFYGRLSVGHLKKIL